MNDRIELWRGEKPLILASQSSSRQMLLRNAGLAFKAVPAAIDERLLQANSGLHGAGAIAALLARAKAQEVALRYPGHFVIGADQTLALGSELFDKPSSSAQAAEQIRRLAGRTHELHSAIAVVSDSVLFETVAVAKLTMRALSKQAIETYLAAAGDKVTGSVGAYQLEGLGIHLFERIEGDHFIILGLPLLPLLDFLRRRGLLAF